MLTKLVELLSCTVCFLGIIVFNYFQVVQSIDLLVVYSLGGVTIMGNSVIILTYFISNDATDALNQYYKGCISSSVLLSAGKESLLKS